jgi:DNA repair protein RadA/Sms
MGKGLAMGRDKTVFFCRECGYENAKWLGKCPGCGVYNTFVEERLTKKPAGAGAVSGQTSLRKLREKAPVGMAGTAGMTGIVGMSGMAGLSGAAGMAAGQAVPLADIEVVGQERWDSGSAELNRVLGGGVVPGSLVLLSGEPGIGKSTFMLQMARFMGGRAKVLYISGEESLRQLKLRADRLDLTPANPSRGKTDTGQGEADLVQEEVIPRQSNVSVMAEVSLDVVGAEALEGGYQVLIIDSIQTMMLDDLQSAPGSVSQVRECAAFLMRLAKDYGVAVFMVGHVTKDGAVAGPRVLEHMVDTVLCFEGDQYHIYRLLRASKNRFGPSNEIGVFEMRGSGLVEVRDLSGVFLEGNRPAVGSAITVTMEGTRPLLVEIQALATPSVYGQPRRTANGLDYNRLLILLAVLDKRIGFPFAAKDVFVNVAGGLKISEPAVDIAVVGALLSALKDRILPAMVMVGELGLTGEVRGVAQIEQRILEARDFGFERCMYPEANAARLKQVVDKTGGVGFYPVKSIEDVIQLTIDN